MVIQCKICFESYTAPGTRHAPYSAACGHVMGKECLEKLKDSSNDDYFYCPFCSENIEFNDCHPIYDIIEEFKDIDKESSNTCKNLKENFYLLKDFKKNINGSIKFFDEHNGNVLIAGETPGLFSNYGFIKLINTKEKKIHDISKPIFEYEFSCLCFNKWENDVIEFCVGYVDGRIKLYRYSYDDNMFKRLSKNTLFYLNFSSVKSGKKIINSICFLPNDTVAFSYGRGKLRIWNKREEWLSKTQIFKKIPYSENDNITHLKCTKYGDCIGIMNNRIYVFPKDAPSYELASQTGKTIISYSFNEDFNRLLVLYSNEMDWKRKNSTSQTFVLYKIIEEDYTNNFGKTLKKYYAINLVINYSIEKKIPISFIANLFAVEQSDGTSLYHGILPNIKENQLEIISLHDQIKSKGYEDFKDIKNCLGITFVDGEDLWTQRDSRKKVVIIFKNKVVVMDIF
uniref:RING-type domain-containing protein n=1 Tax=Strongyloides papillosus TaxID=174720 RepID=A0A0N5C2F6_STREA